MESNHHSRDQVQYRVTFLQDLVNPPGMLIFRVLSVVASGFLIYRSVFCQQVNHAGLWLTVVSFFLLILSCSGLLYGYGHWTRSPKTLAFTKIGLKHDYGGAEDIMPYEQIQVGPGIAGVSVVKSASGRFILVPSALFSKAELQKRVSDHQPPR